MIFRSTSHQRALQLVSSCALSVAVIAGCSKENADRGISALEPHESEEIRTGEYVIRTSNSAVVSKGQQSTSTKPLTNSPTFAAPRPKALLTFERSMMKNDTLSIEAAAQLLKSDQFAKQFNKLELESSKDSLAREMTELHRDYLEEQMKEAGTLTQFACGLSLCVGVVDAGRDSSGFNRFRKDFLNRPSSIFSLVDYELRLDNGKIEKRFVMSVDPGANGISMKSRPPVL